MYEQIDKELLEFVEDVLLNRCENATERMMEFAATLEPKCKPTDLKRKGQAAGAAAGGAKEVSGLGRRWVSGAGWQHRLQLASMMYHPALCLSICLPLPAAADPTPAQVPGLTSRAVHRAAGPVPLKDRLVPPPPHTVVLFVAPVYLCRHPGVTSLWRSG